MSGNNDLDAFVWNWVTSRRDEFIAIVESGGSVARYRDRCIAAALAEFPGTDRRDVIISMSRASERERAEAQALLDEADALEAEGRRQRMAASGMTVVK